MISALAFVRHSSIWRQVAPTLEQFVRWVNTNVRSIAPAIAWRGHTERNPLIAEVGFRLAEGGFDAATILPFEVEERARQMILQLPRGAAAAQRLHGFEWQQAAELGKAIRNYTATLPVAQFSPTVPGCGVVDTAIADILSEDNLIEVKAVKRPFRGSDFRQVLTYAAMYYASGREIRDVAVYNPRLGDIVSMPLDSLAVGVSGHHRVELMQDIVSYMTGLQTSA